MHANVVIGLLMLTLVAQAALSLRLVRLRARVGRLEGKEIELFQSITEVRGWAGQEARAVQGEILPARVDDSAASAHTRREKELAPVLEKLADAEVADEDATTMFDPGLLRAELHRSSRLSAEEEQDKTTPQGECDVTLVTVVQHREKEGST